METSKNVSTFGCGKVMIGGAEGTRTPDPLLAKQVLSQLSYSPTPFNVPSIGTPQERRQGERLAHFRARLSPLFEGGG